MRQSLVIMLLGSLAFSGVVQASGPAVESVEPGVGQRGTEFSLKLVGAGLNDQTEVVLYAPGVTCVGVKAASENELTVTLKADANCPLGSHPFRLRTTEGISEMRVFRMSPLAVVASVEPNESPKQSMPVARNVTVTGVLETADADCFEVTLKKGERLAAEVEAVRLGQNLLDTVLTIYGPDAKILLEVDDTSLHHQDPFGSIEAAADGKYVVEVREAANAGDSNSRYALHIGTFPRPAFAFPPGGPAGQTVAIRFHGDALGIIDQKVAVPAAPVSGTDATGFGLYAEQSGLAAPTSIPFRVSPFDNVLEAEPNDELSSESSKSVELPIAFNGVLEKPGDVDRFRFRMTAGQTMQFEAFAQRLGSRADTVISILDAEGTLLVRSDDDVSHDSRLAIQAPHTGEFQLHVIDKRGAGEKDFFYRIEAASPQPNITAFLPRPNRVSQERQTISIPRGNRVMSFVAVRRQGVQGPATVELQNLPAGVTIPTSSVPGDQFLVPVVFEAAADAPFGGTLVSMHVGCEANGTIVTGGFQQVVDLVAGSADSLFQSVTVDRLAVAVIDSAGFSIRMDDPKSGLSQDGTLALTIHVNRTEEFKGPVDITFPFLPPWVDGPAKLTIPADQTSGVYVVHAFPQAQPRSWSICAEGRPGLVASRDSGAAERPMMPTGGPRGRPRGRGMAADAVVSTQLVTLSIIPSPVAGMIGTVAAEQGSKLKLACSVERTAGLPETMVASLEGLPNRVTVCPVTISANAKSIEFLVELQPTAPLGSFKSLVCRLTGKVGDQQNSYCIGRGGVLKIEPAGALITDKSGRPLSPLEVLRQNQKKGTDVPKGTR